MKIWGISSFGGDLRREFYGGNLGVKGMNLFCCGESFGRYRTGIRSWNGSLFWKWDNDWILSGSLSGICDVCLRLGRGYIGRYFGINRG